MTTTMRIPTHIPASKTPVSNSQLLKVKDNRIKRTI